MDKLPGYTYRTWDALVSRGTQTNPHTPKCARCGASPAHNTYHGTVFCDNHDCMDTFLSKDIER